MHFARVGVLVWVDFGQVLGKFWAQVTQMVRGCYRTVLAVPGATVRGPTVRYPAGAVSGTFPRRRTLELPKSMLVGKDTG